MGFKLTILGSSAAVPTKYRYLSSQILEHDQTLFLIDCGEGAQLQMLQYEVKRNRIDHIFISHLHGDHYFGLIGLLNTLSLENRAKPLLLYAPEALKAFLDRTFSLSGRSELSFPIHFIPLEESSTDKPIFENNRMTINAIPLIHSVPTWGFIFREKPKERNIKHEFIAAFQPDYLSIKAIKKGADFIDKNGNVIENKCITIAPPPPVSYAYLSDTCYDEALVEHIQGIDCLYHEATFGDAEEALAKERFHTTSREAATLAKKAGVKKLLLGHISARFLDDVSVLKAQAQEVFPNTTIVSDGDMYDIPETEDE